MSTQELIFVVIGGIGLVLLVGSMLLGGDADAGGEVDVDANSGGNKMPSSLSLSVVTAAMVGFGAVGWIALSLDASFLVALLCGLGGAVVTAAVMHFAVLRPLAKQQSNSMTGRKTYADQLATVTLYIPVAGGYGEVSLIDANGARVSERAWSYNGQEIPRGTSVVVAEVIADGVRVKRSTLTSEEEHQ